MEGRCGGFDGYNKTILKSQPKRATLRSDPTQAVR